MAIPFVREFDDLAEAMAVPNPNRPIQEGVAQFGRQVCDQISARPEIFAPTILQSPLRAACQPYWDGQGFDGPVSEPPFTGGQCNNIEYRINVERRTFSQAQQQFVWQLGNPFTMRGPISIVNTTMGETCADPDAIFARFELTSPNNQTRGLTAACTDLAVNYRNLTMTRVDGQPDTCGNPPEEVRPGGNPAPDNGPLPPGTGPQVDIRGNPILVLPPTLEVSPDVTVELSPGEINLGSGVGGGAPGAPVAAPEVAGENSGGGGGDNDFPEPPDGERWVGCCVTVVQRPVGHGSIPQSEPETIFPDIIGNVRLKFLSTLQTPEYDTPLINKQKTTCVWEPVRGLQIVGVRVNLRPGFEYSVQPYSVPESN